MDALISGRAGVALVVDGGKLASIHATEPDRMVPREPRELPFLAGEARDFTTVENASRERIARELTLAQRREENLLRVLILLDRELPDEIRAEAGSELELTLDDDLTVELENILYTKPLPAQADLQGGLVLVRESESPVAEALLERLSSHQEAIAAIWASWELLPEELLADPAQWQSVATHQGAFRELAFSLKTTGRVNDSFVLLGTNPQIRSLPNSRSVLQTWLGSFLKRSTLPQAPSGIPSSEQPSEVRQHPRKYDADQLSEAAMELAEATTKAIDERLASELVEVVQLHAGLQTGTAAVPVPGLDVVAITANTWTMYARINEKLALPFGENVTKNLAAGVVTKVASKAAGLLIAGSTMKLFPGLGSLGGAALMAGSCYALTITAGVVYMRAIAALLKARSAEEITQKDLKEATQSALSNKAMIRSILKEARKSYKKDLGELR